MHTRISGVKKAKVVVEKTQFDSVLGKLLTAKPVPRTSIKTTGKHSPKPILAK